MPRTRIFHILAVVLFAVALLLNLVDDTVDPKLILDLLLGGLASLAAGFIG